MAGTADLEAARTFVNTHARLLDRRRMQLQAHIALADADTPLRQQAQAALTALAAYANDDGGYGSALEPDLRCAKSQPVTALHAFEVFGEAGEVGVTSPAARALCDWLDSITLTDGGLPFALPFTDSVGSAPFWVSTDPAVSNLHMTAMLAAVAHRVGRHDAEVRAHPWLARATAYTWRGIEAMTEPGHALEYRYVLNFLDARCDEDPRAAKELERLGAWLPRSGRMAVAGGLEDEAMRPLDFAPLPDRPVRTLLNADVLEADLDRVAADQRDDGGWAVDFASHSPMGALEWRGYATVEAVRLLRVNGRL